MTGGRDPALEDGCLFGITLLVVDGLGEVDFVFFGLFGDVAKDDDDADTDADVDEDDNLVVVGVVVVVVTVVVVGGGFVAGTKSKGKKTT